VSLDLSREVYNYYIVSLDLSREVLYNLYN
jgi:hypothetical protein